jgi:hypothetical protein
MGVCLATLYTLKGQSTFWRMNFKRVGCIDKIRYHGHYSSSSSSSSSSSISAWRPKVRH